MDGWGVGGGGGMGEGDLRPPSPVMCKRCSRLVAHRLHLLLGFSF